MKSPGGIISSFGTSCARRFSAGGLQSMAISSSFKQQCPSCEALVPIKDGSLVGKKVDCPKCKYRFVVEDPVAKDKAAVGGGAAKKGGADTAKRKDTAVVAKSKTKH